MCVVVGGVDKLVGLFDYLCNGNFVWLIVFVDVDNWMCIV